MNGKHVRKTKGQEALEPVFHTIVATTLAGTLVLPTVAWADASDVEFDPADPAFAAFLPEPLVVAQQAIDDRTAPADEGLALLEAPAEDVEAAQPEADGDEAAPPEADAAAEPGTPAPAAPAADAAPDAAPEPDEPSASAEAAPSDEAAALQDDSNAAAPAPVLVADAQGVASEYATLAEALAAVADGGTVTLQGDCAERVTVTRVVSFTLLTGGNAFTGSITCADQYVKTEDAVDGGIEVSIARRGTAAARSLIFVAEGAVGGSLSVSGTSAAEGAEVVVTAQADEGYILAGITVVDANNASVRVSSSGGGTYTFVMPGSRVNVSASFIEVPEGTWYAGSVVAAIENGYMSGSADGEFASDDLATRGQAACVLANMAGTAGTVAYSALFDDVAAGRYYSSNVTWAAENGIMFGYQGTNSFGAEDAITREQMAAALYNYAKSCGYDVSVSNVEEVLAAYGEYVSPWARVGVAWAIEHGIMGNNGQALRARDAITRAEMASMAVNYQPSTVAAPIAGVWYEAPVSKAARNRYMGGYTDGNFGTLDSATRGQVACVLANMAGAAESVRYAGAFADVLSRRYYANNIAWAVQNKIMFGYADDGTFGADDPITREQMVCALRNYAKAMGQDVSVRDADEALAGYPDGKLVSVWARTGMAWAIERGIIGNNGQALRPRAEASRAEVAAMAVNYQPRAVR